MPTYTDNVIEVMRATIEAQREKLAAANALLEQATDAVDEACYPVWWEAYRSHLSGAAPAPLPYAVLADGSVEPLHNCPECGELGRARFAHMHTCRSVGKADQAVLDAMAEWPEEDLRDPLDAPPPSQRRAAWRVLIKLCRAELARRGVTP